MPLASRVSAMKAASTTNVAPCSACAGPNTAPLKECAIMMWSRTSTQCKGATSEIVDPLAQDAASRIKDAGQACGEIPKRHRRFEQHVKSVVGKQAHRHLQAPAMSPSPAVRWCDHAHLTCHEPEP